MYCNCLKQRSSEQHIPKLLDRTYCLSAVTATLLSFRIMQIGIVWTYVQNICLTYLVSKCTFLCPGSIVSCYPEWENKVKVLYLCIEYCFVNLQRPVFKEQGTVFECKKQGYFYKSFLEIVWKKRRKWAARCKVFDNWSRNKQLVRNCELLVILWVDFSEACSQIMWPISGHR